MGTVNQVWETGAVETQQPLLKLAKQASGNELLLAANIKRYSEAEGLSWPAVGRQLQLDTAELAKLALCRAPRRTHFRQDLEQIAAYTGVNPNILRKFIEYTERQPAAKQESLPLWPLFTDGMNGLFKRRAWSLSLAVMFLFILGAVAFAQPKPAQAATLVVMQGQAVVMQNQVLPVSAEGGQQLVAAGRAMSVNAGDEISLGAGASAQLRLFDGSTVDLFENTSLQVTELQTSESKYRVGLNMLAGKTVSRVKRLLGVGDAFKVSTPSSTASVRGTVFTVEVLGPDSSYIACDEGIVWVEMEDQQVEVSAGYEVTAVLGQPLNVQSQMEEAPVIIAAAPPVEAPPVNVPPEPEEEEPVVEDPPPVPVEAPPVEVPAATPDEDSDDDVSNSPVVDVVPPTPPVKAQDKPRPPVIVIEDPTEGEDEPVDTVVTFTSSDDDDGSLSGDLQDTDDKTDKVVPGNTPTSVPGEGTPPTGGGTPPGQENNENSNAGGNNTNENSSSNNSESNAGKKNK